jgi:hypothetical protein
MSSSDKIDEVWVMRTAALVGLDIAPERVVSVTATLRRVEQLADVVNQVELDAANGLAPTWKP